MLACRACRIPLTAEHGCALCESVRPHLVSTDEGEEASSLSSVSAETIAALRAQLKHVRTELREAPRNAEAAKELIAISNSVAKVIESARKLQADGVAALANMAFVERAELFIGWYAELPPAYRGRVRDSMEAFELEVGKPTKALSA